MTKTNPLTRKAGPLPVWVWAALVLVAGYVYLHRAPAAQGGAQLPYTPASTGSTAQSPASGQGSPVDNGNSDLLDALGNNLASSDALLAALQAGGQGGGYGVSSGGGANVGGSDTSTVTAPTQDSGTNNAPISPPPPPDTISGPDPGVYGSTQPYTIGGPTEVAAPNIFGDTSQPFDTTPDALSRYLSNTGVDTTTRTTASVTSPTPTVVQPAPVDTGGVIVHPGQAVAV